MPDRRATGDIRKRVSRVDKGVGFAHITLVSQGQHKPWEREGQYLHMLLKERRKGDCGNAINSEYFDNSVEAILEASESESPGRR